MMGDYNIDLMKTDIHSESSSFLDTVTSFCHISIILRPTRITPCSKTLIDNIFTNIIDVPITSGNLTCSISDHLAQFAILDFSIKNIKSPTSKYIRNFKKFDKISFIGDFVSVDWPKELNSHDPNLNLSNLISKVNSILDSHAP